MQAGPHVGDPVRIAAGTVLSIMAGLIIASRARLADLSVRPTLLAFCRTLRRLYHPAVSVTARFRRRSSCTLTTTRLRLAGTPRTQHQRSLRPRAEFRGPACWRRSGGG